MPAPLSVASSLFLYGIIPCVPFIGYSIVVPTVLSLFPPPDACSPNLRLYLLVSYALAYLFLLHSFSIVLYPLPGFSCFHRLDVKLFSLACLSTLHLLSLAHAVLFLLLPAYLPNALSSVLQSSTSTSSYLPLPLSSACTSGPTFMVSLAGVGVQSFFLLWLLCTAAVAWCEEEWWKGWTAEELQEIEEAKVRHAQWRAEEEEERRRLIDGKSYQPADAVTPQQTEKEIGLKADSATGETSLPRLPLRESVSSKLKEKEEQKEQEDDESGDEDEIMRYQKAAAARRQHEVKEEQKENSEEMEDETEEEEDDDDEQESEHSDADEPLSAKSSSSSSTSATASDAEALGPEEEGDDEDEDVAEEQEQAVVGEREDSEEADANVEEEENSGAVGEQQEADANALDSSDVDNSGMAYSDQYGALAAHAPSSRSAAAPPMSSTSTARNSADPLLSLPPKSTPADIQQPTTASVASSDTARRVSHTMSRTTAVKQPADIFGVTVPLVHPILSSFALSSTVAGTAQAAELPLLPPMPAFSAAAPITIPISSFSSVPATRPLPAASASSLPTSVATSSFRNPPLPIVALPLRRPQLAPLLLQPPLPTTAAVFGRATSSSSPPLPISPIPLSPKAFLASTTSTFPHPPLPVASPSPSLSSAKPAIASAPKPASSYYAPPLPVTGHITASPSTPLVLPAADHTSACPPRHSPIVSSAEEQPRHAFLSVHSEREVQLVAELKEVQRRQHQQQPQQSAPNYPVVLPEPEQESDAQTGAADTPPSHQRMDEPQLSQQQHPHRLSGTGQFVVETSDGPSSGSRDESVVQCAVDQPAEAVEDEISFSDDEDGAGDRTARAEVAEQQEEIGSAAVIEQSVIEQSVVVEEEVEEEVF